MNNRYKPEILNFNVDWVFIKDACMQTISKRAGDKEPSDEWKKKLLMAQHSPLRRGTISWRWEEIPSYVMNHIVRHHVGCTPYVSTSRSDRTGIPREERKQTDFVSMQMDANIQSLIDMAGRRLCAQADAETIKYMKGLIEAIREKDEILAWALVPQCIRTGGCTEKFGNCKFFETFSKDLNKEELIDTLNRYDKYNEHILKLKK